jgi:hypothetical protein
MPLQCRSHAALCRGLEKLLSEWHGHGMSGNGMACMNQTRPHYANQMGKTQSKPLAERHGMCELDFTVLVEVVVDMYIGERACSEGN